MILRTAILLTITVILPLVKNTGLKKGIQKLSDINVWLSFVSLAFIFIIGPTVFIMETTVTGFGNMLKIFFPYGNMVKTNFIVKIEKKRISTRLDNILLVMVVSICAIYRFIYLLEFEKVDALKK